MSYRNPKLNIDIKSGQYLREMGAKAAAGVSKFAATQLAIEKNLAENQKIAAEQKNESQTWRMGVMEDLGEVMANSALWDGANIENIDVMLDKGEEIFLKPVKTPQDMRFLTNLNLLDENLLGSITGMSALSEGYENASENSSRPGGLATDAPPAVNSFIQGFITNTSKGKREVFINCDDPSGCFQEYRFTPDNKNIPAMSYTSDQINSMMNESGQLRAYTTISDYPTKFNEIIKENKFLNENGKISDLSLNNLYNTNYTETYDPETRKRTRTRSLNYDAFVEQNFSAVSGYVGSITGAAGSYDLVATNNQVIDQLRSNAKSKPGSISEDFIEKLEKFDYPTAENVLTQDRKKQLQQNLAANILKLQSIEYSTTSTEDILPKISEGSTEEEYIKETQDLSKGLLEALYTKDADYFNQKTYSPAGTPREISGIEFKGPKGTLLEIKYYSGTTTVGKDKVEDGVVIKGKKTRDQYRTKTINLEDKNAMSDLFKNLIVDGLYDPGKTKSKIMTTFQNIVFPNDIKLRIKEGTKPSKDVEIDEKENNIPYSSTAMDLINNVS